MNSVKQENRIVMFVALLLLSCWSMIAMGSAGYGNAYADDGSGKWCRKEGGRIVDVIKLTKTAHGLTTTFHEGENAPTYAEGFGMVKNNNISLAVVNVKSKQTIFIEGTIEGANLRYRSFNLDGTFRWEGSFTKCN